MRIWTPRAQLEVSKFHIYRQPRCITDLNHDLQLTWKQQYLSGPSSNIKQRKFSPNEKIFTSRTTRLEWRDVRKMSSIRGSSVTVRLASAIAAEGILDDSEPLGSGRPFRYFRSAIVEVQAHVRTVIPYVANYSLAQFFVGNARPRKLNSYENFCVYGRCTMKQEAMHYLHYKDLTLNQINEKKNSDLSRSWTIIVCLQLQQHCIGVAYRNTIFQEQISN